MKFSNRGKFLKTKELKFWLLISFFSWKLFLMKNWMMAISSITPPSLPLVASVIPNTPKHHIPNKMVVVTIATILIFIGTHCRLIMETMNMGIIRECIMAIIMATRYKEMWLLHNFQLNWAKDQWKINTRIRFFF